jgi:hypothetical protein
MGGAGGEAQQNLSGVEGDGDARQLVDLAALKAALRKLNCDQPIETAARTLAERGVKGRRLRQKCGNDVAGGLRVRRRPTIEQAEIASKTAVVRDRMVLRLRQPLAARGDHRVATGIDGWEAAAVGGAQHPGGLRQRQFGNRLSDRLLDRRYAAHLSTFPRTVLAARAITFGPENGKASGTGMVNGSGGRCARPPFASAL